MRSSIILSLLVASNIALAQKNSDIPIKVRESLSHHYVDAKRLDWSIVGDSLYDVTFIYHEQNMMVVYGKDGVSRETHTGIAADNLPDDARKYLADKGKVKRSYRIVKDDGTITYEATADGAHMLFDETGNFMRKLDEQTMQK